MICEVESNLRCIAPPPLLSRLDCSIAVPIHTPCDPLRRLCRLADPYDLWQQESPRASCTRRILVPLECPRGGIVLEDHAEQAGRCYEVVGSVACENVPPGVALEEDGKRVADVPSCGAEDVAADSEGVGSLGQWIA